VTAKLAADVRADVAAVAIARGLLRAVEANLPGALAGEDPERLHDLRVAVRRTRALQRELAGVFAPEPLRAFRDGFRGLQAITGPVRDLDVGLLELDELVAGLPADVAADVAPLRGLLERRLRAERAAMAEALGAARTHALLHNWSAVLDGLVASDETGRPDAARPVADVAGHRIRRVYKRMVRRGRRIDDDSPAQALHDLRKRGKELRYLLEFFSSLYPAAVVGPMVGSLKALQDVLGRFQDRAVQAELLRSLAAEAALIEGGTPAVVASGELARRLAADARAAHAEFAERFAIFAAKPQRALVKSTFR
jgi:CHAD domain-containing protein